MTLSLRIVDSFNQDRFYLSFMERKISIDWFVLNESAQLAGFHELKLKGKATEHYLKFFDLWRDADPGIAEVEDAMKRVAGLKGSWQPILPNWLISTT